MNVKFCLVILCLGAATSCTLTSTTPSEQGPKQALGTITGMVLGGLIGKGATGKDNGAAAGAVIGGIIAADKKQGSQQVVGYKQVNQCSENTTYTTTSNEVYSHSVVEFYHEGRFYRVQFNKVTGQ